MFGVAKIRKQLYITEAQEEALKAQARSAFPRRSWRAGPSTRFSPKRPPRQPGAGPLSNGFWSTRVTWLTGTGFP